MAEHHIHIEQLREQLSPLLRQIGDLGLDCLNQGFCLLVGSFFALWAKKNPQ